MIKIKKKSRREMYEIDLSAADDREKRKSESSASPRARLRLVVPTRYNTLGGFSLHDMKKKLRRKNELLRLSLYFSVPAKRRHARAATTLNCACERRNGWGIVVSPVECKRVRSLVFLVHTHSSRDGMVREGSLSGSNSEYTRAVRASGKSTPVECLDS